MTNTEKAIVETAKTKLQDALAEIERLNQELADARHIIQEQCRIIDRCMPATTKVTDSQEPGNTGDKPGEGREGRGRQDRAVAGKFDGG